MEEFKEFQNYYFIYVKHKIAKEKIMVSFKQFEAQIHYFNGMYKLPIAPVPTIRYMLSRIGEEDKQVVEALQKFKQTLLDEVEEVEDIIQKLEDKTVDVSEMDLLTGIADWLGDIQVFCASEMIKYGIPIKAVTDIIMESNYSKLQSDGSVEYDRNGKVLKGPNYWKPEPKIKALLEEMRDEYFANKPKVKGVKHEAK